MKGLPWHEIMEYYSNPEYKLPARSFYLALGNRLSQESEHCQHRLAAVKYFLGNLSSGPRRILDLCCAGAYPSRHLAKLSQDIFVGLDISEDCLRFAKRKVLEEGLSHRVSVVQGDALHLPFEDKSFDATFCIGFLEYLRGPQIKQFFDEVKRVTRDQFILTVTSTSVRRKISHRLRLKDFFFRLHKIPFHRLYSAGEFSDLLVGQGFKHLRLVEVANYTLVASVPIPSRRDSRSEEKVIMLKEEEVLPGEEYSISPSVWEAPLQVAMAALSRSREYLAPIWASIASSTQSLNHLILSRMQFGR